MNINLRIKRSKTTNLDFGSKVCSALMVYFVVFQGQMCSSKMIQMQMMDEVVNEYTKQFAFVKLKRRTPAATATNNSSNAGQVNGVLPQQQVWPLKQHVFLRMYVQKV